MICSGVSVTEKMKAFYLVIFVAFATEKNSCASAQRYVVHACKDGTLRLNCRTGLIEVHDVILADSTCTGRSCCPRQSDCRGSPSPGYRNEVRASCSDQTSCAVRVEIRDIGCGWLAPRNDHVNITYSCKAIPTSPSTTTPSTPFPTTRSSSSASTWQPSTTSTSTSVNSKPDNNKATEMGQQSTPLTSTQINTPLYTSGDKNTIEIEEEDGDKTSTQSSVKGPSIVIDKDLQPMPGDPTPESKHGLVAAQLQTDQDKDYGYLDRVTTLVAVIVGGVVITATVIAVAVVVAVKKRRIAKTEEQYDMPTTFSCQANNDAENVRNSNFYDFIPDSGNCSARDSHSDDCSAAKEGDFPSDDCCPAKGGDFPSYDCITKESDYLTPMTERDEAPYVWIP